MEEKFDELKNNLLGKNVSYIRQGGHTMAYFTIDEVVPTYDKEELRFYGNDGFGCRHHFPLTFEQAEELINKGGLIVYTTDRFHKDRKPKPLWQLILS